MKKLICSLMVATMLFGTVVCVSKSSIFESYVFASESDYGSDYDYGEEISASDYDEVIPASDDENYCVEQHTKTGSRKATHKECLSIEEFLNEFSNDFNEETLKFDYFKKLLDYFFKNNKDSIKAVIKAVALKIFKFRNDVKPEDIVDTVFYLVDNGIFLDGRIKETIYLSVPSFLSTDEGRKDALYAIAHFCQSCGTVCILATGDIIDSDGKIYNYKGEEYTEDELDAIANNPNYWTENRFRTRPFDYGIFVLPDGSRFNCSYSGTSGNHFIDSLDRRITDFVVNDEPYEKIIISTEGITLDNGTKFSPKETGNIVTGDIEEYLLKQGISQVVFDLVRHGKATEYVKYVMLYLSQFDTETRSKIYGNVENLRNFVISNFCQCSLDLALRSLEMKYIIEHQRS